MKVLGFNINVSKNKNDGYDHLRNHPNRVELAKSIDGKQSLIIDIKQMSQQLTQNEIKDWRSANQLALNFENPKRFNLLKIYYDAMLDEHLLGAIRNRKMKTLRRAFKIVDESGTENEEATKLLRTRWFKKFINHTLDSIFYGHSLIQFGDIIREGKLRFKEVKLVPREHVVPEYHVIIKEIMDEPNDGLDYETPPFVDWCIPVGEPSDLGLLLPVSKSAISKKYALQFWDQFAEIFGMPIRIGKSSSRNKKEIDRVETMLEDMGSAAWGLFPEGTELQIIESTKGDAFNVYDKRVDRANKEMSKAILGQTMTMDDGSSKSQAQVHENVSDDIAEDDADLVLDTVNDDLIPFLIKHGFPLKETDTLDWDNTYEYTPEEMKEIEEMILEHFDVNPVYFSDKYGIDIIGKKQNTGVTEPVEVKKK